MKNSKKKLVIIITILIICITTTTPVMASTTLNIINADSGIKIYVPHYLGREKTSICSINWYDLLESRVEIDPETISESNLIAIKNPSDEIILKLIFDSKKFPDAYSLDFWCTYNRYHEETKTYCSATCWSSTKDTFLINSITNEKEIVLTLEDIGYHHFSDDDVEYYSFSDIEDNPVLSFTFKVFDKDLNSIYFVSNVDFLIVNENDTAKLSSFNTSNPSKGISIEINNKIISSDISPIQENDSTFVPIRVISENLGAKVDYNPENKKITISKDEDVILLTLNNKTALTNGISSTLTVAPKLINGTTFVPIRLIAEAFNCDVQWDAKAQKVVIIEK